MDERFDISRRKALAALGTIGVASAGAGLGTSAYFSDTETFENNQLMAGTLDLKVTASHHYVDWLPDTEGPDAPESPQETNDAGMADGDPDITLDDGDIEGAQPIELSVDDVSGFANGSLVNNINDGVPIEGFDGSLCDVRPDADGNVGRPVISLDDVKPGDFGFVRFAFASCENPAFVWFTADITESSEGEVTEPERDDPDEDYPDGDSVELKDNVVVSIVEGDVAQLLGDGPVNITRDDNLRGLADKTEPVSGALNAPDGGGAEGARDCFEGRTNHYYTLVWWVPIDHGNEIQGDSVTFELGLYAEQCRHNDGELNSSEVDNLGETDETDDDAE